MSQVQCTYTEVERRPKSTRHIPSRTNLVEAVENRISAILKEQHPLSVDRIIKFQSDVHEGIFLPSYLSLSFPPW